jgi:drug/metabolite transporter (DMT)-like permease
MLYFFFSLVLLVAYYFVSKSENQNDITKALGYLLLIVSIIFFCYDFYIDVVLASQVKNLYAGGAGITYTNANNTTTSYMNSSDYKVGYYIGNTSLDFSQVELLRMAGFMIVGLIIMFFVWNYITTHNAMGNKLGE